MAEHNDGAGMVRTASPPFASATLTLVARDAADYEWRPTFLPEMKLAQATRSTFLDSNPLNQLYLAYAQRVGELEHPKRSIQVARDLPRLRAYKDSLQSLTGASTGPVPPSSAHTPPFSHKIS